MTDRSAILAAIVALLVAVSACTHIDHVRLTGREHPSGWSDQVRETARITYQYAQMANNAYADAIRFKLPPDLSLRDWKGNNDIGFAYAVFERRRNGRIVEIIIAYRGTEWGFADIWYGNILARQNRLGLEVYDTWRTHIDWRIPISVTGHSLGGGIATYVSLCRPNVDTYIFNSSPRFRRCGAQIDNRRYSVVEHGEALKVGRIFGREASQTYTSIGCTNRADPFRQHKIRLLAECLTGIAAWESRTARGSLIANGLPLPWEGPNDER